MNNKSTYNIQEGKIDSFQGDYFFLSNFYYYNIKFEGDVYSSVEHAYQAAKTENREARRVISNFKKPGEAKRYGRDLKLIRGWENIKVDIMESLLRKKFEYQKVLREKLVKTSLNYLEEGNMWHDNYWGVCHCNRAGCQTQKYQNVLGKLLMKLREEYIHFQENYSESEISIISQFRSFFNEDREPVNKLSMSLTLNELSRDTSMDKVDIKMLGDIMHKKKVISTASGDSILLLDKGKKLFTKRML